MSLPILKKTDFVGIYDLSLNANLLKSLETQIPFYEENILRMFFSDEFYKLIKDQTTANPIIDNLINGCEWTDENSELKILNGFKQVLLNLIYFEISKTDLKNLKVNKFENSEINSSSNIANYLNEYYDRAINLYKNQIVPFWEFHKDLENYEVYKNFNMPILPISSYL